MEEILASIRKIIAEDSSGLRPASAPPRPGTPYSPAPRTAAPQASPSPAPQRGFMTREAFLKSSQPAEPEPRRETHAPIASPRSSGGNAGISAPTSRLEPRDDTPSFAKPSPISRERSSTSPVKESFHSREDAASKEMSPSTIAREAPKPLKPEALDSKRDPRSDLTGTVETATLETIEVVAIEDALPVVEAGAPSVIKVESEPASKKRSDTANIEAQLTELLSEDLNALRQSRAKAEEQAVQSSKIPEDTPLDSEGSDPFAFDLGPSPFAAKPEPEVRAASSDVKQPPAPAPAIDFAPAPKPTPSEPERTSSSAAVPAAEKPDVAARPNFSEPSFAPQNAPQNGSHFSSFGPGIFPASDTTPAAATSQPASIPPPKPEADAIASKSRQTFVVPSVSATIGPSRKLEPLSNAFQPAPAPPPRPLETFSPAPEVVPEPPRVGGPFHPREEWRPSETQLPPEPPRFSRNQRDEDEESSSSLPATVDSSLDRPMEDAVADLLRPLLKTWLAENMPKIVERALRREMTERLLPGQKNPRD